MKSEINRNVVQKPFKFPCLMASKTGNIYLITGMAGQSYVGTRVAPGTVVGEHGSSWSSSLKPFEGSVTLSND